MLRTIHTSDHWATSLIEKHLAASYPSRFLDVLGFPYLNAGLSLPQSCNCAVWASVLAFLGGCHTQRLLARATTRNSFERLSESYRYKSLKQGRNGVLLTLRRGYDVLSECYCMLRKKQSLEASSQNSGMLGVDEPTCWIAVEHNQPTALSAP